MRRGSTAGGSTGRDRSGQLLATLASLYLAFALRTTRWRLDGPQDILRLVTREPVIFAFWHERLLLMPCLWRVARRSGIPPDQYPRTNFLVSRHRDGVMIARVVARFGGRAVHGSSGRRKNGRMTDRGGAGAFRKAVGLLRAGEHLAVTPHGPRGPARQVKDGLVLLSILSGRPIVACAARSWPSVRLPTWDRMMVPLPFGRGVIALGTPLHPPRGANDLLERHLDDQLDRADARA